MNRAEGVPYPMLAALAEAGAAAVRNLRAGLRFYAEARRRAATARQLRQLNDHLLRDLGLHRSQIDAVLRGEQPWS